MKRDKNGRFLKGQHWREPKPHWNYDWLFDQYITKKKTVMEIAKVVDCKRSNIQYWLTKHNIPIRNISEVRKLKYWGSKGKANGMYGKTGEKNPQWKNGCTPERQSIYSSLEWKLLAQEVFKRDNYKCQRCDSAKKYKIPLHIHHITAFNVKEKRLNIDNLVLLCKDCHNWVHSKDNENKEFINE